MVLRFVKQKSKRTNNKHVIQCIFKLKFMLILWTFLILILSLYPSSKLPENPGIPHLDKLVHFMMYLIFSLLWIFVFIGSQSLIDFLKLFLVVFVLSFIIEFLQGTLPINRSASIYDGLANFIGVFSAIGIYRTFLSVSKT